MDMQVLYAGDTSDVWEISHVTSAEGAPIVLAELDANYSCRLVVNAAGAGAIDRLIADKNAAGPTSRAW